MSFGLQGKKLKIVSTKTSRLEIEFTKKGNLLQGIPSTGQRNEQNYGNKLSNTKRELEASSNLESFVVATAVSLQLGGHLDAGYEKNYWSSAETKN